MEKLLFNIEGINPHIHQILKDVRKIGINDGLSHKWKTLSDKELWFELCLCILSSNVPYRMAESALLQLLNRDFLDYDTFDNHTKKNIAQELMRPIYLPKKKNGRFRSYRFPNLRARYIFECGLVVRDCFKGLSNVLKEERSAYKVRNKIVESLPGIGMKEASMFLRDVGFTDQLAIVDRHILKFIPTLIAYHGNVTNITKRRYLELEERFQSISQALGATPLELDFVVWNLNRSEM